MCLGVDPRERERERGGGEFMGYFEILVHSLLSVDIPKDKNLLSPRPVSVRHFCSLN